MSHLVPSPSFLAKMAKIPGMNTRIERVLKELEIFAYFADKVPTRMEDKHWERLCRIDKAVDRMAFVDGVAITLHREEIEFEREEMLKELTNKKRDEAARDYAEGRMAYFKDFHSLILGPRKKDLNHVRGSRVWTSLRVASRPRILLDFQFMTKCDDKGRRRLCQQVEMATGEQLNTWQPFPLSIINADERIPEIRECFSRHMTSFKTLHADQKFLPDVYPDNPFKQDPTGAGGAPKKVVYISKFAPMMDGPLDASAYIMPITFDRKRETVAVTRSRTDYVAHSLPILKYVKWKFGPLYVPFSNMFRILNDVALSGGDWQASFKKHISIYRLMDAEEQPVGRKLNYEKMREQFRRRSELIKMIEDTLGPDPSTNT